MLILRQSYGNNFEAQKQRVLVEFLANVDHAETKSKPRTCDTQQHSAKIMCHTEFREKSD